MSDRTYIEWADATWNPVTGCTRVSEGCQRCYIDRTPPFRMEHRRFQHPDPVAGDPAAIGASTGVRLHPERLAQPLAWRKPRRIFVCSLADLFHDDVPTEHIAAVFAVMALAPQHTFQVLTKRPARMRALLSSPEFRAMTSDTVPWPLPNVWVGVSAESQEWALRRIPLLLRTPAAVRWVSAEPLLGPIDLADAGAVSVDGRTQTVETIPSIDWLVAGGESGPRSRPMHPDWARDLRDQCAAAGVPFLFKQWGDWTDTEHGLNAAGDDAPVFRRTVGNDDVNGHRMRNLQGTTMVRLGKGTAGRELDGRTHDAYPAGTQAGAA